MLLKWRKKAKLSQAAASAAIGAISGGTFSKLEAGQMFPGPELLLNIRAVTGLSADRILDGWAAQHLAAVRNAKALARRQQKLG